MRYPNKKTNLEKVGFFVMAATTGNPTLTGGRPLGREPPLIHIFVALRGIEPRLPG